MSETLLMLKVTGFVVEKMFLSFCFFVRFLNQKTRKVDFLFFMVFDIIFCINFVLKSYGYYFFIIILFSS